MTPIIRFFNVLLLISSFTLSPVAMIGHALPVLQKAEAANEGGPTVGHLQGFFRVGSVEVPGSLPHAGATVNVKLIENSDTVIATATTDASGAYDISVPFGSYILCFIPASGYRLADGVSQCAPQSDLAIESTPIMLPTVMVVALPTLRLIGENPYILTKGADFSSLDPGAEILDIESCGGESPSYLVTEDVVNSEVYGDTTVTYRIPAKVACGYDTQVITRIVRVLAPKSGGTVIGSMVSGFAGNTIAQTPKEGVENTATKGEVAGASTECRFISAYMRKTYENDTLEVLKLQAFLIFKAGDSTVRPTGIYDEATENAVRAFQDKYRAEILDPWGQDGNTGIVGMLTQKKVNDMYCGFVSAFTNDQQLALRESREASSEGIAKLPIELTESVVASESISDKMARWWNKAKESLVAAFPLSKDKEGEASTIERQGNLAATDGSTTGHEYSWMTIIISLLFGSAVVLLAGYLFKKTRIVVEKVK